MLSSAAGKPAAMADARSTPGRSTSLFSRKIWLPKLIYLALPWFYLGAGITAFLATLYINEWFWILPHYVLFSVACGHLGIVVLRRRRRRETDQA
jgi:Flp pilus assembly protein TadB